MATETPLPAISAIVLTWNGAAYIEECLTSLLAQEYAGLEVLVVDNGSTDGTPELVAECPPDVRLIRNERNLGFAAGNNVGLRIAGGELLVLLNQDTKVHPGFLLALARTFEVRMVGIAGCKLLCPDGTIQHAGGYLHGPRGETGHVGRHATDDGQFDEVADVDFVTAAALAISRAALDEIGLLDEGFAPAYYEDVDWCYRARAAGFRVVYQPEAVVTHKESTSTSESGYWRKFAINQGRIRFLFKHWPLDRLSKEFAPAEIAWLTAMERSRELMTARHAYLNALLGLSELAAFRHSSPEEATGLRYLLSDLRLAALASLVSWLASQDPSDPGDRDARADGAKLLEALRDHQTIREEPFHSQVPIVGRLIASFRSLWNGVSTKWYVRPMMHQQSVFNSQVVSYLQLIQKQVEGGLLDTAENVRELTAIAERLGTPAGGEASVAEGSRGSGGVGDADHSGRASEEPQ
jgi:GT2 family glycosyltransferase